MGCKFLQITIDFSLCFIRNCDFQTIFILEILKFPKINERMVWNKGVFVGNFLKN